jgi:hypothetical protein
MGFGFHPFAKEKAQLRQDRNDGNGFVCAKCGCYLSPFGHDGDLWYAIPRIPIHNGGKKSDNCVIVCPKCFSELKQDGTKFISYKSLPYFKV